MCSTDPLQFRWLKDIFIAHVIIIIKSEVSSFPLLSYFSVVVCLRCLLHHILSRIAYTFRENWDFLLRIRYGLQIVFVCLYITPSHYHHCAKLSVDIELMKCLPDIFCRVCEYDWAYSLSYSLFNIWGSMFSVYPIPSWWLREYIALAYYHHQIENMNYYPLFRVRSWNNGMRCMSLYILIGPWTYAFSQFVSLFGCI